MGPAEGKTAVITGGASGMAWRSAKLFIEEGAYVFIFGRRQEALDEAVKLIGRNCDRARAAKGSVSDEPTSTDCYDTVKRGRGTLDVVLRQCRHGEAVPLGEITAQHFDATFDPN